jgi:hypothetical protein
MGHGNFFIPWVEKTLKLAHGLIFGVFFQSLGWRNFHTWNSVHSKILYSIWMLYYFWNIIIQWTSYDDLTEKSFFISKRLLWSPKLVKWQKSKLHFAIWQKNCFRRILSALKSIWRSNAWMDPLENFILYQFLVYFLQVNLFSLWIAYFN